MTLLVQIQSLTFNFLYGIFSSFMFNLLYHLLFTNSMVLNIITNLFFLFSLIFLYFYFLFQINFGIIHIYYFLLFGLGFFCYNFLFKKIR